MLALRHFACQSRRILPQMTRSPRTQCSCGLATDSGIRKTRNQLAETPRCSSMVGNLNSRLRNYFTLRRQLGGEYLRLLQFFLNHRTFLRSRAAERVGKSAKQLMTGSEHPHWLTMLGFGPLQPQRS